jgi:hypothetical protein
VLRGPQPLSAAAGISAASYLRAGLRVSSRDGCFSLDYGWRVLLDSPMPAGRFPESPPDQSLVRHGAGALWCLRRFGDSCRCEKSGRIRRARPGRRRIPRPGLSSGSALPLPGRGPLTRLRARSAYGVAGGSIRGTASSVPCGEFRGGAVRGKWVRSPGLRSGMASFALDGETCE